MKREIKFRAFVDGCMYYPQETYGDVTGEYSILLSGEMFITNEVSGEQWCHSTLDARRVNNPILMQYTGLKDKNGKEIYEGDILSTGNLESGHRIVEVYFKDGCFYTKDESFKKWRVAGWRTTEIIGNIYENPELLN